MSETERAALDVVAAEGRVTFPMAEAMIMARCNAARETAAAALHCLDDAGRVILRNGWLTLSEAEKKRRGTCSNK